MTETGMFIYPWDLGGDFEQFKNDYADTGCNSLVVALSYHHGTILSARTGRTYILEDASISFAPTYGLYGKIKPAVNGETVRKGTTEALRSWCRETGRLFCGWIVLLHNSTIGRRHPEVCRRNALGDVFYHSLCPSNPDVRHFARTLVRDIFLNLQPDSVLLESAAPPTPFHGGHHEIANVLPGSAALWLNSLCFCPHCLEAAHSRGAGNPEKAKKTCAALFLSLLNHDLRIPGDEQAQLTMLLLEYPELFAYQQARQAGVAEFVHLISGVAREYGVRCGLIPSARPFSVSSAFFEGTGYSSMSGAVDLLVPLIFGQGETFAKTKRNIQLVDSDTPVGMAMTLLASRNPERGGFLEEVVEAKKMNPACAYFSNFSIASKERLDWMREAAAILGHRGERRKALWLAG